MARASKILQKNHESVILLSEQMTSEERMAAHLRHSQLLIQIYRSGMNYREGLANPKRVYRKR